MLIVDKYYQIVEKDAHLVSWNWKAYHLLSLFGAVISSLLVSLYFNRILQAFDNNCMIDARLNFQNDSNYNYVGNFSLSNSFHNPKTIWGQKLACDTCIFVFMFFCVAGIILAAFFCIVPKGGFQQENEGYVKPWRIVVPSIFVSILAVVFTFIYFFKLTKGIKNFCNQFEEFSADEKCGEDINLYTLIFHEEQINVFKYITIVKISSYFVFIFWISLLVSLLLRIYQGIDFKIIVYNLNKNKKETVDLDTSTESLDDLVVEPQKSIPTLVVHISDNDIETQANAPANL